MGASHSGQTGRLLLRFSAYHFLTSRAQPITCSKILHAHDGKQEGEVPILIQRLPVPAITAPGLITCSKVLHADEGK